MGIFYTKYLREADDEDNFDIKSEEDSTDNNDENKEEELDLKDDEDMTVDADATEKQAEENNEENTSEEPATEDNETETSDEENLDSDNNSSEETSSEDNEDFTINPEDDGNTDDDTDENIDGEENTDLDTDEDNTDNNIEDSENGDDTKAKFDAALYDTLNDNEKANKNAELLSNYKDLYISCDNIIEKINDIGKDVDNIKILQRVACTLSDLKFYISFYLDNNYKNKSYYENDVMFNKYLAILNGVKNVLEEFMNKNEKTTDESK